MRRQRFPDTRTDVCTRAFGILPSFSINIPSARAFSLSICMSAVRSPSFARSRKSLPSSKFYILQNVVPDSCNVSPSGLDEVPDRLQAYAFTKRSLLVQIALSLNLPQHFGFHPLRRFSIFPSDLNPNCSIHSFAKAVHFTETRCYLVHHFPSIRRGPRKFRQAPSPHGHRFFKLADHPQQPNHLSPAAQLRLETGRLKQFCPSPVISLPGPSFRKRYIALLSRYISSSRLPARIPPAPSIESKFEACKDTRGSGSTTPSFPAAAYPAIISTGSGQFQPSRSRYGRRDLLGHSLGLARPGEERTLAFSFLSRLIYDRLSRATLVAVGLKVGQWRGPIWGVSSEVAQF